MLLQLIAGIFTLEDASKLVFSWARLLQKLPAGDAIIENVKDPIISEFLKVADTIAYQPAQLRFISNVTGKIIGAEKLTAGYWVEQACSPFKFVEGLEQLKAQGCSLFLEIGPDKNQDEWKNILENVSRIYLGGGKINWKGFEAPYNRKRISLPTYPFQRTRYWYKALENTKAKISEQDNFLGIDHSLAGKYICMPSGESLFVNELRLEVSPYLKDHQIYDTILFPAAGYIEILLAAGKKILGTQSITIKNLIIQEPLSLSADKPKTIQVQVLEADNKDYTLSIHSQEKEGNWICHGSALLSNSSLASADICDWEKIKLICNHEISTSDLYQKFAVHGAHYGPQFQTLKNVWVTNNEVAAELHCESDLGCLSDPRILDGCFQALSAAIAIDKDSSKNIFLPFGVDALTLYSNLEKTCRMHGKVMEKDENSLSADIEIFSLGGEPLASIKGFRMRKPAKKTWPACLRRKII